MEHQSLKSFDEEVFNLIKREEERQQNKLSLIPSENFTMRPVREALSSVFVHKYAEGQIGKRYYEGNQVIDELDALCKERVRKAFGLPPGWSVNVQPLAGSNANLAVYNGLLKPGDTILSMFLPDGGHLSHGWSFPEASESGLEGQVDQRLYFGGSRKVSIVSKMFRVIQYKVDPKTRLFDYHFIEKVAKKYSPQMIISGGTAYPREIDYKALSAIASKVSAFYLADIAHEAGLVASGVNSSPVGLADIVTFTTHKTLRGPRGAVIMGKSELMEKVDFGVFPGLQGGPFEHNIASIAVAMKDVLSDEFKQYSRQIVKNAQKLAACLMDRGYDVVTGGTDKHLVLVDLRNMGITGRNPATALDHAGIVLNRNSVPNETGSPMNPSGIRMGTPTVTTRGMKEPEMVQIADWIDRVMREVKPFCNLKPQEFQEKIAGNKVLKETADEVRQMCSRFRLNI